MATLKRYSDFKSLKRSTTSKVKKAINSNAQHLQEVETFFKLLKKTKSKSK